MVQNCKRKPISIILLLIFTLILFISLILIKKKKNNEAIKIFIYCYFIVFKYDFHNDNAI